MKRKRIVKIKKSQDPNNVFVSIIPEFELTGTVYKKVQKFVISYFQHFRACFLHPYALIVFLKTYLLKAVLETQCGF